MPFIQNVSYPHFKSGQHKDPGENAIAIQILSAFDVNNVWVDEVENWPVSPYHFKAIHRFKIDDVDTENGITEEQAEEIVSILVAALAMNENVIVHCAAGISRSGAVCDIGTVLGFDDTRVYRNPNVRMRTMMLNYVKKILD